MEKIVKILLSCYLVLFPFGVLGKLPFSFKFFPEVNFYLADMVVGIIGIIGLIWLIKQIGRGGKKYKFPQLARPFLIFLGITAFSLIINVSSLEPKEILVSGLYWLRLAAYFGLYLIINWTSWPNWKNLLLALGTTTAILGLMQYFILPDLSFLKDFGWDPHYYRLAGTFLDPNFTGIILVLTIILLLTNFKPKNVYQLLLVINYIALALTYSRASYLALLVGGIAMTIVQKKFLKITGLMIFIILITVLILPRGMGGEGVKLERFASVESRWESWQQALIIAKDNLLWGVGFNGYRYVQKRYGFLKEGWQISHSGAGADNSFLFILATSGILGLGGLLGLVAKILTISFKKSLLVFGSVIAILVHSLFNNTLFFPWVMGWLAIILGEL